MYENIFTGEIYDSMEAARDYIIGVMDEVDILEVVEHEYLIEDLIRELARLESPLYLTILEKTEEQLFDDYIREIEED